MKYKPRKKEFIDLVLPSPKISYVDCLRLRDALTGLSEHGDIYVRHDILSVGLMDTLMFRVVAVVGDYSDTKNREGLYKKQGDIYRAFPDFDFKFSIEEQGSENWDDYLLLY